MIILRTLNHGIEVVGEYIMGPYMRCRIIAHPLFGSTIDKYGCMTIRRSRVVMTSMLGRKLHRGEHIHHVDGNKRNDDPTNLELLSAAAHNREHKTGTKHREDSKKKTSESLRKAYAEGRHAPPNLDVSRENLRNRNRDVVLGLVKLSWAKPERNAKLITFYHKVKSIKETAKEFGIHYRSASEIIKKYDTKNG